jgi:hypothetical protein
MHPEVVPAIVDGMVYTTMFPGGNRHTNRPVISGGVALHALNDSLNKASPPLEDTQAGGEKSLQSFAVPAGLVLRNLATPLSAPSEFSSRLSDKTNPKSVLADDVFDVLYNLVAKNSSKQREAHTDVPEPSPAEEKDDQEVEVNEEEKDANGDNEKADNEGADNEGADNEGADNEGANNEGADNEAEKPAENEGEGKEDGGPPEDSMEPSKEALTNKDEEPKPTEEEEEKREEGGKVSPEKPFKKISIKVPTKRTRGASNRKTRRKPRGGQTLRKPT